MSDAVTLTIKALVLDMDDTINKTTPAMHAGLTSAARRLWPHVSDEALADAVTRYVRDDGGWFEKFSSGQLDFVTMRRERLGAMARQLGAVIDAPGVDPAENASSSAERRGVTTEQFERFEIDYRKTFIASCRPWDDALRLMGRADEQRIPIAVLSNSARHMTLKKVAQLGLEGRFVEVLTSDQFEAGKPDPVAYRSVCRRLGLDPGEVGYVDDFIRDAAGGLSVGMRAVWLDRGAHGSKPSGSVDLPGLRKVTCLDQIELRRF